MARGHDRHIARQEALSQLGRPLARRARSRCELCGAQGLRLDPYEVAPVTEEPDIDRTLLMCGLCREGLEGKPGDPSRWRFLEEAAWSDFAPIQVVAVRMLRQLSEAGIAWATATADSLYLSPEVEAWLGDETA